MEICRAEVEKALLEVKRKENAEIARAIEPIVRANYDQGRLHKFLAGGDAASVPEYVNHIVMHFKQQRNYVRQVQEVLDRDVWEGLFVDLQKQAYGVLRRKQFLNEGERFDHAVQCATEAATIIARRRFPYDTRFGAWAYVVVHNVCMNHMRQSWNGRSVPEDAQVSLDAWDEWLQNFADPDAEEARMREEQRVDLLQHVAALADAQREFVTLYYLEQKSYDRIAAIMGRSKNTLYKLNFDALDSLRKNMLVSERIRG